MLRFYKIKSALLFLAFLAVKPHFSYAQCTISNLNAVYCTDDAAVAISAGSATNFIGNGVAAGVFTPSAAGVGSHTITANDRAATYGVVTIGTFDRVTPPGSETTLSLGKDTDSGNLGVGDGFFNFDFFGTTYNQLRIGSNGLIGLGTGAVTSATIQALPDGAAPDNIIAAIWGDMTGTGTIKYWTTGFAPFRVFIVDFDLIRTGGLYSSIAQVKLFETTNIIEVHTETALFATNGDAATQGIENATGSVANTVAGRNNALWDATNDYKAFVPICLDQQVVTVYAVPAITVQPIASQAICEGSTANFSVTATGTGLTYQWKKNGVDIGGATANTYSIPATVTASAGTYTVEVSGDCSVTSTASVLTINEQPEVITPPSNQTVCVGQSATFTVNAGVTTGVTYQWRKGGVNIGGATGSSYTIPVTVAADAGSFDVVVSGTCTPSVTSTAATLTINALPAITGQPVSSQAVCEGSTANFSVTATGAGLTYQWKKNGVDIGGATANTFSIPVTVTVDAGTYTVVVSGTCTPAVTSTASVLTINEQPEVITPPSNQTVCVGQSATFTVNAGVTTGVTYQWRKGGVNIGGATGSSYTIPVTVAADAGSFDVVVSGTCTPSVTSAAATLTINALPAITGQPVSSQAVCEGSTANFSVTATGTGLTYQWKKNGVDIGGATANTFSIPAAATADAGTYTVVVSGTCTPAVTSTASVLTINEQPEVITPPSNQTVCVGQSATFTVNAGVTTGVTYQWRKGGVNIGGATGSSYTIPVTVAADAGSFDVVVSGTCTPSVTSAAATLTINALPAITGQPVSSQAVCEGSTANFSVTATGTGLTYQWKKNGVDIGGATANTFSIPAAATADAGTYTVVVSGTCTPAVTSTASVLTINEQPEVITPPSNQTVCAGQSVTFTVNVGVTTGVGYQWRKGGVNIGGATGSSYTIPVTVAADAGSFDVVVSGTCTPSVTSAAATLTINALPAITGQPVSSQAVCEGSTANFSVTATGTGLTYQWKKNGVDIGGATANTFSIPATATADAGTYTVVVSGTCTPAVTSTASVLTINEQPEVITPPSNQTVCVGQSATFTVNAGVTTGVTYQWRKGGVNIGGATGSSYTIPVTVAADAGSFDVVVSGTCTPSVTSTAATLTINALPAITGQPVSSQAVCEGSTANFSVTATGTGLTYQWKKNGVDIGGATANTFSIPVTVTVDAGTYTVVVSGTCTPAVTSTASVLTINEQPEVITPPSNQTVCAGQSVTFTVNVGVTTGVGYQWRKGGVNIGGATGSSYTIPVTVAADAGSFDVVVSGTCTPSVTSAAATLTINALPVITVQPIASQAICEGSTANFSVTATGTGLTYQWKKNGVDIGGATANTFSIPAAATADAGTYTVVVSGTCTPAVTSTASVLTINEQPEVITPPSNQTVCAGQSVTFTVNVGVTTGVGYQWRKGGVNIGGATGSSYTIPVTVAADAGSFDVVVSGTCTPSVTSTAATLTINALPAITGQPVSSQAVCEGSTANFSVTATGTGLTYQWKKNGVDIGGATANTFSIPAAVTVDAGTYTVVVSGTCTPAVTSTASVLTINEQPEVITPPSNQTVCVGQSATFTVNAGVTTGVTYQWRKGGVNIGGATGSSYTIPVTVAADAGSFDVVVSGTCTPSVTSTAATLTINALPAITGQPVSSQAVCEGSTANFSVTATGTGLTYQWKKNGVDIGGATANTFSIPVTVTVDAGTYTVVVSGTCTPAVTSTASVLTINEQPEVITPPSNQTVCAGQSVTFTVNVGVTTGVGYQWRKGGVNIGGATGSSYTIPVTVAGDAGSFDVVVSGTCTPSVTSAAATLTINALPVITVQPIASQAICEGSTANFSVTATGTGLTYQWKKNGVDIGGATANTFSIPATATADAGTYTVVVSGTCTPGVTSSASVLTINEQPEILTPPTNQTVCAGQSVTFTVNVGVTTGVSYQWRKGGVNIGGATGSSYTIPVTVAADAGSFDVVVSGTCTPPVISAAATLTINALPVITVQPIASQAICEGSPANFSVTATGTLLTYQWKKDGVDIGGATSNTYNIPTATTADAGIYTVVVSGTCTPGVTSTASVLTINEQPEILTPPSNQTVCEGQSVTFTVNVGVTTGVTYQWRKGGVNIGGATGNSYTIPVTVAADAGSFDVVVSGTCTPPVISAPATLTINALPAITVQPIASQAICEGSAANFSVTATGTGLSYQWKKNGVDIVGATANTFGILVTATADAGTYTVVVSGTCTPAVTSTSAVLTINEQPEILTPPSDQTVCAGQSVTFTVNAGVTTGVGYQWRKGGVNIGGATGSSYTIPVTVAADAGSFDVVVSGTCTPSVTSAAATLTINALPVITVQPIASQAICEGSTAIFSVTATGTVLTYQWKKNGVDIGGATANTFSIPATVTADAGTYTVVVSGTCTPSVTSTASVLTINEQPEILTPPSNQTVCEGQSVTFTVNVGVTTGVGYQWRKGGVNIGGATGSSYTIPVTVAADAGSFDVVVSGTCTPPVTSTAATLTINALPAISVQPIASQAICEGSAANFSVTATGTGLSYQWKKNGVDIGGATANTFSIPATVTADAGIYSVVVSGTCTPAVTSTSSVLTINEQPEILTPPSDQTVCAGQSVTFTVNAGVTTGVGYQWRKGGVNIGGATGSTYTIPVTVAADAGSFDVVVSGTCTPPVTSTAATLTINALPAITVQPIASQAICEGSTANFSVTATGTVLTYQWKKNGVDIGGATANTFSIPATVTADAGTYTVVVSGTCVPSVTSTASILTINEQPEIITPPSDQTVCAGQSVTFTVNAGVTTGVSYQWRKGGVNIGGATGSTYTIPVTVAADAGTFDVVVSGTCTPPVTSTAATLTINALPAITVQPIVSQAICEGSPANFSVTATGTVLTYQWKKNGVDIGGATANTFSIPATVTGDAGTYTVVVSGTCTPSVTSTASVLTINEQPEILTPPSNQTVCEGQSVTFTVNVGVTTGVTYQWRKGGVNIGGATGSTYTIPVPVAADAGSFDVVVSGTCTPPVTSTAATLIVNENPEIVTGPVSSTICEGANTSFTVNPGITTGATYQWQLSANGGLSYANVIDGGIYSGATTATLNLNTVPLANNGHLYRVTVSGTCAPPVTSNGALLTINQNVGISVQPVTQTICEGSSVIFAVTTAGTGLTYQWRENGTDITNGGVYSGATTATLTLTNVSNTFSGRAYSVVVTGTCGFLSSGSANLTVNRIPNAFALDEVICSGLTTNINITNPNSVPSTTFTWTIQSVTNVSNASPGSGNVIAQTLTSTDGVNVGTVTYLIHPSALGCNGTPPYAVNVTVNPIPNVAASPQTICSGSSTSVVITNPNAVSGTTFSWTALPSVNVVGSAPGNGSTISQLLSTTNASIGTVTYTIKPTANSCDGLTTNVIVTVNPIAMINAGADFEVCEDEPVNLAATASGATSTVLWTGGSGAPQFSPQNSVNSVYTLTAADIAAETITFTITTNDPDGIGPSGPCLAVSDQVVVTVNKLPAVFLAGLEPSYAENDGIDLLEGFPLGGVFSGPGIVGTSNAFNPANAGVGVVTIRYTYTDANSCANFTERSTIVNPVTDADFYILENGGPNGIGEIQISICANQDDLDLVGIPAPSTGGNDTKFLGLSPALVTRITSPDLGVTWKLDTDGLLAGTYQLQYIYENSVGATDSVTKDLIVFSAPVAVIDVGNICIEDVVTFLESSSIPNNFSSGTITTWTWFYDEGTNGSTGSTAEPQYLYQNPGTKNISLEVLTDQGCRHKVFKDIIIGNSPIADFTWASFCRDDVTTFEDKSTSQFGVIDNWSWDFGDGQSSVLQDPPHQYGQFGVYDVKLSISTDAGCSSDTTKQVYILDRATLSNNNAYKTDFESGQGTWVAVANGATVNNSWMFGTPTGASINSANSGTNAWWTGGNNQSYFNNEESFVIGPCLDLSSLKRPMISLKYFVSAQEGFDGAVVQYSTDGGNTWNPIGDAEGGGIGWYNGRNLNGQPGGQSNFGWTGLDSEWRDGRYNLDAIDPALRDIVIFRIAFGSNDDNLVGEVVEGFAFDDIYIGEKTRNVLVEHFTNTSSGPANIATEDLDLLYEKQFDERDSSDFILVQYHMAGGQDDINLSNTDDPQARALLYGISQPPSTLMDGIQGDYFGTTFNGSHARITPEELDRRALEDPLFDIQIDSILTGGTNTMVRLAITYTYIDSLKALDTPVTLYAALLERGVPGSGTINGHVVRKLLLGGAGRTIEKTWTQGSFELANVQYALDVPIVNQDSLYIVAFVQDQRSDSKRVLQSRIIESGRKKGITIVGLPDDPITGEIKELSMYPNPASKYLNFSSEVNLSREYKWQMIDQRGVTVLSGDLNQDFSHGPQRIDVSELANGIYYIAIQTGDKSVVHKKVAIMNRN